MDDVDDGSMVILQIGVEQVELSFFDFAYQTNLETCYLTIMTSWR